MTTEPTVFVPTAQNNPIATTVVRSPGGKISSRPLHIFFLCDCSNSMSVGGKIQSLNSAIKESLPILVETAAENPEAEMLIRIVKFTSTATWHISTPTPVNQISWVDLVPEGQTAMGAALSLVAEELKIPPMSPRALPPVLVLFSDGKPTDKFDEGLETLMAQPWGQKAARVAIAIGRDADTHTLARFIGDAEFPVLSANNADQLKERLRYVSTIVTRSVIRSQPVPSPTVKVDEQDVIVW
jgi:uncharacterized protein YegL